MTFLITAGPTREPIDPVRYISNRSSGKMGYAIAEAALDAGHDVILISGPVNLAPPRKAKFISVSTSDEMFDAVHRHADESDICVLCAAVADYKPAQVSPVKIKKSAAEVSLELIPTRDILQSLGRQTELANFFSSDSPRKRITSKQTPRKNCAKRIAISSSRTMRASEWRATKMSC